MIVFAGRLPHRFRFSPPDPTDLSYPIENAPTEQRQST